MVPPMEELTQAQSAERSIQFHFEKTKLADNGPGQEHFQPDSIELWGNPHHAFWINWIDDDGRERKTFLSLHSLRHQLTFHRIGFALLQGDIPPHFTFIISPSDFNELSVWIDRLTEEGFVPEH